MRLTYDKDRFIFENGNAKQVCEMFKNGRWKAINQYEYVTSNLKAAAQFWRYADAKAGQVLNRAFVKSYKAPLTPLPSFLDDHQVEGVNWILTRSRSYLAHAPGAGKTVEAIVASLWVEEPGSTLFIVPPALTLNWKREIEVWYYRYGGYPGFSRMPTVSIVPESKYQDRMNWQAEFIICPDSMLAKPWVLDKLISLKKKFVAVDEASRFKEATASRTIALFGGTLKYGKKVPGLVFEAKHSVLLDGSPMPNRSMELWAPTYAMCPEAIDFMTQEEFGFKYCGPTLNDRGCWEFKFNSNSAELKTRLQEKFMHVVTEKELNHPERKRSLLYMSKDVRLPKMVEWERKNDLTALFKKGISEANSHGEIATLRRELGIKKVNWIADYVKWRLEVKNESILLFAWHREVCEKLHAKLSQFNPGLVMGGTVNELRETYFKLFQKGDIKLIIGNIGAMGRGHNLQRADRIVFGEYSWSNEANLQCEKRASRKGSVKLITRCDYIVCPDSFDERVLKSIFYKTDSVKRIIG